MRRLYRDMSLTDGGIREDKYRGVRWENILKNKVNSGRTFTRDHSRMAPFFSPVRCNPWKNNSLFPIGKVQPRLSLHDFVCDRELFSLSKEFFRYCEKTSFWGKKSFLGNSRFS